MEREAAYRELEAIYADLAEELARLRPACQLSGRCCRFKEYGHKLWTTRLELDYLLDHVAAPAEVPDGACPYQKEGLCGVRDHRMLGCRAFFCDPEYKWHMGPVYEKYHARIKEAHVRHGIPYEYGEFLSALRQRGEMC